MASKHKPVPLLSGTIHWQPPTPSQGAPLCVYQSTFGTDVPWHMLYHTEQVYDSVAQDLVPSIVSLSKLLFVQS